MELLVVIAILAGLLLPSLNQAKQKAQTIKCKGNIRQIGAAMLMYLSDNREIFPVSSPNGRMTLEDWIYWYDEWGALPGDGLLIWGQHFKTAKSPIGYYLGGIDTNLLRCPIDAKFKEAEVVLNNGNYYPFSYTLNSASFGGERHVRPGMASQYTAQFPIQPQGAFSLNRVVNPPAKIMMAEEWSRSDAGKNESGISDGFRTSGFAWNYNDRLTKRHQGRANVFFPDGHAETVKQSFGSQLEHTDPLK